MHAGELTFRRWYLDYRQMNFHILCVFILDDGGDEGEKMI